MLLFHGSRAVFNEFDDRYIGSGENAGVGCGFYFTSSLKGAAAHAERYARGSGDPRVYVCRLKENSIILDKRKSIFDHKRQIVELWERLPVALYVQGESDTWFADLGFPVSDHGEHILRTDKEKCDLLKRHNFDAIFDYERTSTDAYLHGVSTLVLNAKAVEVVEVHAVNDIVSETVGSPRAYVLTDTLSLLGGTKVLSFLRREVEHEDIQRREFLEHLKEQG